jgi:serine/threonine protein kinase
MAEKEHNTLIRLENHPNIINCFSYNTEGVIKYQGTQEEIKYSVLEFASNGVFASYVRACGPIEEEIVRFFTVQLLSGIEFIHSQGFAHLDLKLENILLDSFFNIKIADLGSSMEIAQTNGAVGRKRGTYAYMAPEVFSFEKGEEYNAFAADIYCLGVSLFVMLVGEFPTFIQKHDGRFDTNDTDNDKFFEAPPCEEI